MRSQAWRIAVMFVLLATGACSADAARPGAAAKTALPQPNTASTPVASPAATSSPTSEPSVVDAAETVFFTSPTGNIACSMGGANAVCEIKESTFEQPAKPSDCDLDYGAMVGVEGRQPARFLCHGDTAFGASGSMVAYGKNLTNGLVTCTSRKSGITCTTADGAHGFELSRASYRLY